MSRKISVSIVLIVLLALLGFGAWTVLFKPSGLPPEGFARGNGRIEADLVDISPRLAGRVAEIAARIADSTLYAPVPGRVLYRLAQPGEILGSGGKLLTLVSLADVYMEFFLSAGEAPRVRIGDEARVVPDIMPGSAVPAVVSFVSPQAQFTPKQVETVTERESLMFRIRVSIPPELVAARVDQIKTGVRGVAWVRLARDDGSLPDWPAGLVPPLVAMPDDPATDQP